MSTLDRYLARWVLGGILLALAVLLALFSVFTLLEELGDVGKGQYGLADAAEYLVLTTPRRVYEVTPVAVLLGSLLGLGVLASHSELTVIRAAGVSTWRIGLTSLKAASVAIVAAALLGELVVPAADDLAEARRSIAMTSRIALKTRTGFWLRDGSRFVNVRQVLPDRRLADIYVYTFDSSRRLVLATHAGRARPADGAWELEQVAESAIREDRVERRTREAERWPSPFQGDLVNLAVMRPDRLSVMDLVRSIDFLRSNEQDAAPYELALWGKVMVPLSAVGMALLAVPFVLGPLRSAGLGQRVLTGSVLGISFHIVSQAASQVGLVYGLPPALGATLPAAGVLGAALWLLHRAR
jgi:lipopolysaccharide export system permease protein